ncbi:hypothetical protein BGZ61DRAFT_488090 [Ilyonectria robusta]|uniref:uncharacterized protein n=1 Tax=Ilyonectria robusta TaxID=1079257 RepID=UPI001E8E7C4C|nr:uncharacterized protein BGZ61DRAFT_488090 [Ilyonectria robusta]KAH8648243.1 hypothetical protein BGZ61DRAFT_488090 [Ilyonectria robusta]
MDGQSVSSYLAYKQDTSAFLSWLGSASKVCGWRQPKRKKDATSEVKSPVLNLTLADKGSQRLKGRARKEAKEAAAAGAGQPGTTPVFSRSVTVLPKRTFTTAELIQQIELVSQADAAQRPEVRMPVAVYKALQRAVGARERFARWYRRTGASSDDSMESHDYFTGILTKALILLRGVDNGPGHAADHPSDGKTSDINFMENMFASLQVENTSEETDDQACSNSQPASPSALTGTDSSVQFGIEEDKNMAEIDFAIFSIFEDVHRLRAETQRIWARLKDGDISLIQATLSLAVVIELVRQAEEEAMQVVASHTTPEYFADVFSTGSYQFFVGRIYNSKALGRENEYSVNDKEHAIVITPFDEFVLLPLGHTLVKFQYFWFKDHNPTMPVIPLPPLRMDYKSAASLLDDPRYRNFEAEDQLLVQLCHEMRFIEDIRKGKLLRPYSLKDKEAIKESILPFDDLFHSAMRPIWDQGLISMPSAFAARAMVDMYEICGPHLNGSQLLSKEARLCTERFGFAQDGNEVVDVLGLRDDIVPRLTDTRQLLATLWRRSTNDLTHDSFLLKHREKFGERVQIAQKRMASGGGEGFENFRPKDHKVLTSNPSDDQWAATFTGIWYHESPSFFRDTNLLYGGTALLEVVSVTEQAGIAIANESMSLFCMAHVYNAARQLGGLDLYWPELDRVMELHAAALFANDVPTTPQAIFDRFKYRIGMGARSTFSRSFASSFSTGGKTPQPQGRWMLRPTPTSTTIREFFDANTSPRSLPRLVHQLEGQASQQNQSAPEQSRRKLRGSVTPSASATGSIAGTSQRQMTFQQTLQHFEKHLDAVLPDMRLDYITLTRTCDGLLDTLRAELLAKFNVSYTLKNGQTGRSDDMHNAFGRVETALCIFQETANAADLHEEMKRKKYRGLDTEILPVGKQLEYAAEFLRLHLTRASRSG